MPSGRCWGLSYPEITGGEEDRCTLRCGNLELQLWTTVGEVVGVAFMGRRVKLEPSQVIGWITLGILEPQVLQRS